MWTESLKREIKVWTWTAPNGSSTEGTILPRKRGSFQNKRFTSFHNHRMGNDIVNHERIAFKACIENLFNTGQCKRWTGTFYWLSRIRDRSLIWKQETCLYDTLWGQTAIRTWSYCILTWIWFPGRCEAGMNTNTAPPTPPSHSAAGTTTPDPDSHSAIGDISGM